MKNKIVLLLCFLLLISLTNVVSAKPNLSVFVDGEKLALSQSPIVMNGTTLVPAAPIFSKMGLTLEFDKASKLIKGKKQGLVITLKLNSKIASINGVTVILGEPAKIVNGTTMVPLRLISESLGAMVTIESDHSISIWNTKNSTMYENSLPILISGNFVRNLSKSDMLQLEIVDFYYDTTEKKVHEYNFLSNIIGFKSGSTHKITNSIVGKTTRFDFIYIGSAIKNLKDYQDNITTNINYEKVRNYYHSKEYLNKINALLKAEEDALKAKEKAEKDAEAAAKLKAKAKEKADKAAAAAKLKKELAANKNMPLKVDGVTITYNSIGIPKVNLTIKNLGTKTIIAYEMSVKCYDDFDRPVNRWLSKSNLFEGISQNNRILSGEYQTDTWTLNLYDLATQVKHVKITAVKFSDGSSWKR
ncbi:hypothetical protein PAECIP111893_04855 [Paenibacillus plantiphilus]|uniref:Copper amine oxidase-like N-terminal domain-containing protein n=1 Tax=Paenibacillus plantiphilus TaxID=2905650 RepID=A0ABM9CSW8_9BACL|nr:copper amine oxidase N-terminal domain-containing protein [Paenibacillus plantiphilus]CAH1222519.1 hypothetical protein PAECIP111893_04855 [Paenibacillus plantiphilus]